MKTTLEVAKELLMTGKHINFRDLEANTEIKSCKLAQRIYDLRKKGWNIKDQVIKGKGSLREYWLEPEEIARLRTISEQKEKHVQQVIESKKLSETASESLKNETRAYFEQTSLLIGGSNLNRKW